MKHSKKWADRFMHMARIVASWSKDPTTKVGAVAVDDSKRILESGYNGLPMGVMDLDTRMARPAKYLWTLHAEANLVATAARSRLQGSTVYVTHLCCAQCAALLINAGVARVVCGSGTTSMPREHFEAARQMLSEAGVVVDVIDGDDDSSDVGRRELFPALEGVFEESAPHFDRGTLCYEIGGLFSD